MFTSIHSLHFVNVIKDIGLAPLNHITSVNSTVVPPTRTHGYSACMFLDILMLRSLVLLVGITQRDSTIWRDKLFVFMSIQLTFHKYLQT